MTLKEIAKEAGVSIATVSRVLNHPDYKCSSEEVREKIWDIARRNHYVMNESAKSLKNGVHGKNQHPDYIDVLFTRGEENAADDFFQEMFRDIRAVLMQKNCILDKIWVCPEFSDLTGKKAALCQNRIRSMTQTRTLKDTGLIILGKCEKASLEALMKEYRSIVSCNRNSTNYLVDDVTCDGKRIAETAVEYLIHLGHRKIAYAGDCHGEKRYEGFQSTMFRYNLTPDIHNIFEADSTEAEGYHIMQELLKREPEDAPTAIYAASDSIAVGMLRSLAQSRNRYYSPSVIGSDDIEAAQFTKPMLTTVHIPKAEMGKFAVDLLCDRMHGGHKTAVRVEVQGKLIVRESCTPPDMSYQLEYYI